MINSIDHGLGLKDDGFFGGDIFELSLVEGAKAGESCGFDYSSLGRY